MAKMGVLYWGIARVQCEMGQAKTALSRGFGKAAADRLSAAWGEISVDELDVTAVAKGMEAHFKAALAPFDAKSVTLSREEAVLALGLISALVDLLERNEPTRS
jgi:hypothetical protein